MVIRFSERPLTNALAGDTGSVAALSVGPMVPPASGARIWPPFSTSVCAGSARRQDATSVATAQPTLAANAAPRSPASASVSSSDLQSPRADQILLTL